MEASVIHVETTPGIEEITAYAASTVEGWYCPNKPTDSSIFEFHNDCYQFYTHPPGARSLIDEFDTRPVEVIEKWEVSTSSNVSDQGSATVSRKRDHEKFKDSDSSNEPVNKRRRLDIGSLFKAIPWPHIYVCPVTSDKPSITKGTHAFYPKARPTPIWPHTLDTFNNYLGDRFVRGAWIVPVRGRLPWTDSTPAVVLAPQSTQVVLPAEPFLQECCEITWTWDALSQFWQFLISVRDARNVGPIGFSFHAAPSTQGASPAFGFDGRVSSDSHRAAASAAALLLLHNYFLWIISRSTMPPVTPYWSGTSSTHGLTK
ncbi:hypothetical protein A0H81_13292 [Grifola frondosa]|uniref:Uncharacterized protein n=1 Tax=Grifola frondosa TaxID=5627 RepID=A0A1C7LQ84_GRIFR|nr:hypothetical protein A0H81_13292 [Grifola frondosa]